MKIRSSFYIANLAIMAILATPLTGVAKTTSLLEMADQLDQIDKQDFQAAIGRATSCTRARDFSCAESELNKAAKSVNSEQDKKTLLASRQNLVAEKQRLTNEIRRAEEARQERLRQEEEERQERIRREAREAEEDDEEDDEDAQSISDAWASVGAYAQQVGAENAALLNRIDRQTNEAIRESNRVRAEQAAARDRARAERDEREAERRRDAARERAAREEAEREARARAAASQPELPKYQPQVVTLPKADMVCPPGSTWYNPATGTGAPGGTCYKNSQVKGQTQVASNLTSNAGSNQQSSASGASTRSQTSDSSGGGNSRSDPSSSTMPVKQVPKIKWGPIQLEALAICRKSEKNGKWWCDGPSQNLILFDNTTVGEALSYVGCKTPISAGGGTTKDGHSADVYRCGFGLRSYDRDIAKIHRLVTAQRSYMCPALSVSNCTDFYDGQDKR